MRFETMASHAGDRPDVATGAISMPIYQTSTFVFEDAGKTRWWDCSGTANPTRKVFEGTMAQLEGGKLELTGGSNGSNTFLGDSRSLPWRDRWVAPLLLPSIRLPWLMPRCPGIIGRR